MAKLKVGLYGTHGHQITGRFPDHSEAELVAVAGFGEKADDLGETVHRYDTLDALLADDEVELVSLCSPRRRDQAAEAVQALQAGKHVYAEKPCAMTEADLDAILDAEAKSAGTFHEMAGSAFHQPFLALRNLVAEGQVGPVVQVLAQKSYPMHERRPQDEDVDGGLLLQVGVHAFRFIEHVAGLRILDAQAVQTKCGNPGAGGLRVAVSYVCALDGGAVASVLCNYCNPKGFGNWGNECLRIWGTRGMVEAVDAGTRTRLVVDGEDRGEVDVSASAPDYFDLIVADLQGRQPMPLSLDEEIHPTRMLIRARERVREAL